MAGVVLRSGRCVRTSILTASTTPAPQPTRRVTPQTPRSQPHHHDFAEALGSAPVTPNAAAAKYLGAMRDATHGFTTTHTKQRAELVSLLASHDGHLPHNLGFLAWLYLLDLLANPERLRAIMSDRPRR